MQPLNYSLLALKHNLKPSDLQRRIFNLQKENTELENACCALAKEYLQYKHPQKNNLTPEKLEFHAKRLVYFGHKLPVIKERSEQGLLQETILKDQLDQLKSVNVYLLSQKTYLLVELEVIHCCAALFNR